jgi:hypothetical protein
MSILLVSCAPDQIDTCEQDKINGDWEEVIDSEACSNTEKAEAYLAIGGFDYFDFIGSENPNLIGMLSLNSSNWIVKKGYFDSAVELVSSLNSGTQKTIYLFGSFLGMFTFFTGNLDNGADGGATAFDGEIESVETESFTGSALNSGSGGNQTNLNPTANYQFILNDSNQYYIIDSGTLPAGPYTIYQDNNGDGSGDVLLNAGAATVIAGEMTSKGIQQINQIVKLTRLEDPFANNANVNIISVNDFANKVFGYISQIETVSVALGLDASQDALQRITEFKSILDNGGECEILRTNPALLLVQYFATNLQEVALTDYSNVNLFLASKLAEYGADATFDTAQVGSTFGISDLGIKILFLNNDSSSYIPYWFDATSDIKETMAVFKEFDDNEVAVDGKVVFAEIICASDLLSKD